MVRVGAFVWEGETLRSFALETQPAWDAERARLASLRHPWDPAASAPCDSAYGALRAPRRGSGAIAEASTRSPRARVTDAARGVVEAERDVVDAYVRAAGCGGYAPAAGQAWVDYEGMRPLFGTSRLVILDARVRADVGDVSGAVDRLLAVAKSGTDFAEGTSFGQAMGASVVSLALASLAALIEDGRLSGDDRSRVEAAMESLEARLPTFARALEKERLALRWGAARARELGPRMHDAVDEPSETQWLDVLLPMGLPFAAELEPQERYLRAAQALAARERDGERLAEELSRLAPEGASQWSVVVADGLGRESRSFCVAHAWHRVVSMALARERLAPLAPPPPAVDDPCGTGVIRYEAGLHGGYSFASVGADGVVSSDDVRLTRPPRSRD